MITVMRKHHKILMIIITALVCISFSWFYNRTDFSSIAKGTVGTFYDHPVSQVEFQRNSRLLRLASQLGMRELVQDLTIGAQTETEAFDNFAWNLMVLRHEADQLGIQPTTTEIAREVKSLPAFNGDKGFDLAAYNNFADHVLGSMGFSEAQIEELAADQIALGRLKKILSAGVSVPEGDMRENFTKAYAKMQVALVRFKPEEFAKDVQVSDDEIGKYYDAHKAELKSEEKRQVKFVTLALTDEQKKLTGKERIDALQKLANAANDFTEALQTANGNFDAAVQKFHLTPKETGDITQAAPGPLLAGKPQLVQAAFALTKDSPNSNALQTADGFDILHLVKVEPPHPLTQQQARTQIVETLKKQESEQKAMAKGNEVAEKLRAALKNGQSIEAAANAAGVKLENLPAFTLADTPPGATPPPKPEPKKESPDMGYIKQTASSLAAGGVSNYVAAPGGGFVLVLEKRDEPTKADYDKARNALEQTALTNKGQIVFYEWLRDRRHAAGIQEATKGATATG
jgi:SurA N-terminal domain/PPIC-type PPIASE domain